jgi:hypothetical protein
MHFLHATDTWNSISNDLILPKLFVGRIVIKLLHCQMCICAAAGLHWGTCLRPRLRHHRHGTLRVLTSHRAFELRRCGVQPGTTQNEAASIHYVKMYELFALPLFSVVK